jgi:predicted ATPase
LPGFGHIRRYLCGAVSYLRKIPSLEGLERIEFSSPVTFLVGENGRIARLLANYVLARHYYPMVVVRSRKKKNYLEALHRSDLVVGTVPSEFT